jgi:hypothetical protein
MEANRLKKEGAFTVILAFVLIGVALILSSGYDPRGGLFWSLTNDMYLFNIAIGCEEKQAWQQVSACEEGVSMLVQTKYAIAALGILLIYGVGQYLEFFPSLRFWKNN